MRAMRLHEPRSVLVEDRIPIPTPAKHQLQIRIEACGVCRTDLHVVDGDLRQPKLPIIPGHEIVGRITEIGSGVTGYRLGQRVGVPWLGHTCGNCSYCTRDQENLCDHPGFTGYQIDGGYAEYTVADRDYCFPLSEHADAAHLSPLLCAGLIGFRALSMAGNAKTLGLYGFGAAAHIVAQVAKWQERDVFAFTKPGDSEGQAFAKSLGADWAGGSDESPPTIMDAALLFAPVGALVPAALKSVRKGGIVVCAGIHMSDIPSFPYEDLWGERQIVSVANLTRLDGQQFLEMAPKVPVSTSITRYPLAEANVALNDLRSGVLAGAAVLIP